MTSYKVTLTQEAFAELNGRFPASRGSSDIGKRAVEIVKLHYLSQHPGCTFVRPPLGADLAVVIDGGAPIAFEIKGTADGHIAWPQLKCSSKTSHALLVSGGAVVLRVTNAFGEEPVVFELRHGTDFLLEPEARWTFKAIRGA